MKGIKCCAECANYSMKLHKCMGGAKDAGKATDSFYVDCPLDESEPVRNGKGCSYCKGRAYSKKPLTVITRTMKRVEVVFEYCPACGKKMNGGADNG